MKFTIIDPFKKSTSFALKAKPHITLRQWLPQLTDVRGCQVNGNFLDSWEGYIPQQQDDIHIYIEPQDPVNLAFFGAVLLKAALAVGLSMAIQAIMPKPRPGNLSLGGSTGRREEAFGIAGLTNTITPGTPKFVVYGERRVFGHVIGTDTRVADDGKSMAFSALYFMGDTGGDGYESITDVVVNDTRSVDIPGLTFSTRLGVAGQSVIEGFGSVTQAYSDNRELIPQTPLIYSTKGNAIKRVKLILEYPSGLRFLDERGNNLPGTSIITVEKKLATDSVWVQAFSGTFRQTSITRLFKEIPLSLDAAGSWDLRITEGHTRGDREAANAQLFNVVEVQEETENYPNSALLAVFGMGSSQVQSLQNLEVSAKVKGKKVKVWNGASYDLAWTNQRAWIIRDILTHKKVGLGHRIAEALYDDDAALTVQGYWDELVNGYNGTEVRDRCDLVLNDKRPGWDWIKEILAEGRGALIPSGGKLKLVVDKPKTANLIWSMPGNIVEGSINVDIGFDEKSINTVRGEWPDENLDYKNNYREVVDDNIGEDPMKDESYTFLSITRESQAIRELRYQLKRHILLTRRYRWQALPTAQVSEPFDVDELTYATYKNKRGWSGFVKAFGAGTEVLLDSLVELLPAKTYEVSLFRTDNSKERKIITTGPGKWGKVEAATAFNPVPGEGDIWSIGEQNVHLVPVLIETVTQKEDFTCEMVALAYDPAVYTDDPLPSPTDRKFFRKSQAQPLPLADATVQEIALLNSDGSYSSKLHFSVTPGLVRLGGLVQNATSGTIEFDGAFPSQDDALNGAYLTVGGEKLLIADYAGGKRQATLTGNLAVVPDGQQTVLLDPSEFSMEEISSEESGNPGVNLLDQNAATYWHSKAAIPAGTVGLVGGVLTGTRVDDGTIAFSVPGGTTALLILIFGQDPSAVTWNGKLCVSVKSGQALTVWKLANPTIGSYDLTISGISGRVDVAVYCVSGANLSQIAAITKSDSGLNNFTDHAVTFQAGELGIAAVYFPNGVDFDAFEDISSVIGPLNKDYDLGFQGGGGHYVSGSYQENLLHGFQFGSTDYVSLFLTIPFSQAVPSKVFPHYFILDFGQTRTLALLQFRQRQDSQAGRISGFQVWIAKDSAGLPGVFELVESGILPDVTTAIDIRVKQSTGRFLKVVALGAWDGGDHAALAGLDITVPVPPPSFSFLDTFFGFNESTEIVGGQPNNPSFAEVVHENYEALGGFIVETSPDGMDPWAFVAEAKGTSHEIQSALGKIAYFRFTPVSIFGSKNFRGQFIRPMLLVGDTSAPSVPTNPTATDGLNSVVLAFEKSSAEDLAVTEIYRSEFDDVTTAALIGETIDEVYSDVNLPAPKTFYYWLRSRDTSGNLSGFSSSIEGHSTTISGDTTPPATPNNISLTPSGVVANDGTFNAQIIVAWDQNTEPDLQGYHIEYRKQGETNATLIFSKNASTVLASLLPNVMYEVRARSIDKSNNESAWSIWIAITTTANPGAPAQPTGLTATSFPLSIGLFWNLNSETDILAYELQRANDAGFTVGVATLTKSLSLSYLDQLGGGIQRWYRLRAIRRTGIAGNFTAIVTATTGLASGTDIQAASIGTSHMQDAAILRAKIGDLEVNSLKIANNAVSSKAEATLASYSHAGLSGPGWEDVLSLNFTTTGNGSVETIARMNVDSTSGTLSDFSWRIIRASTELDVIDVNSHSTDRAVMLFDVEDSPSPATYTYKVQVRRRTGGSASPISMSSIKIKIQENAK